MKRIAIETLNFAITRISASAAPTRITPSKNKTITSLLVSRRGGGENWEEILGEALPLSRGPRECIHLPWIELQSEEGGATMGALGELAKDLFNRWTRDLRCPCWVADPEEANDLFKGLVDREELVSDRAARQLPC